MNEGGFVCNAMACDCYMLLMTEKWGLKSAVRNCFCGFVLTAFSWNANSKVRFWEWMKFYWFCAAIGVSHDRKMMVKNNARLKSLVSFCWLFWKMAKSERFLFSMSELTKFSCCWMLAASWFLMTETWWRIWYWAKPTLFSLEFDRKLEIAKSQVNAPREKKMMCAVSSVCSWPKNEGKILLDSTRHCCGSMGGLHLSFFFPISSKLVWPLLLVFWLHNEASNWQKNDQ